MAFTVGGVTSDASGLAVAIGGLAQSLARQGTQVCLFTAACRGRPRLTYGAGQNGFSRVEAEGRWAGRLCYSPALRTSLDAQVGAFNIVHNHSLWVLPTHYASAAAHRHGKPVVFSIHGALEPWAVAHSGWKKKIAARLFQNRDLSRAMCLHAVSANEVAGIRSYGLRNPVAIIPNGVDLADFDAMPPRHEADELFPSILNKKVVLFMARLHPKKGLRHLLRAWKALHSDFEEWHLLIAGPDDGERAPAEALVRELALERSVTFTGSLAGRAKYAALAAASVFVLPSFSEGFSMAILEAMAARLPVLITPGCNFPQAVEQGAGVGVTPDAQGTEQGLRRMIQMSDQQRRDMGDRGRQLVEGNYTWDAVAGQMIQVYQWMQAGGSPPPTVAMCQ